MQIFDDSNFTRPSCTHNTIHAASIYKLVENNFGLSIVPKSLLQHGYDHEREVYSTEKHTATNYLISNLEHQ